MSQRKHQSGFTLLEVMIALSIMAVSLTAPWGTSQQLFI